MKFRSLVTAVSEKAGINLLDCDLDKTLHEAILVANVVRHRDGGSSEALRAQAGYLWDQNSVDYVDLAAGPSPDSEMLRVRAGDLVRYARSMIRFWGLADPLDMAVVEGFI